MLSAMPVTLTGHRGYLGRALVAALSEAGVQPVLVPGRLEDGCPPLGVQCVHLAAHTGGDFTSNVFGTAVVTAALAMGGRLVFASTLTAQAPQDAYDHEKALGEQIALARPDISTVVLRLGTVYGEPVVPTRRSAFNRVLAQAAAGHRVACYGNALAARDFVHLADVVRAFVLALHAPPGVYDVGTGAATTMAAAAALAARQAKVTMTREPTSTDQHHPVAREDNWLPGWLPEIALDDGIARTLAWLRARTPPEERAA